MNARLQLLVAGLLLGLVLLMLAGGLVWSANTPAATPLVTASLATMVSLFALALLAVFWLVALLTLRDQAKATVELGWLLPAIAATVVPGVALWAALTLRSAPLGEWGVAPELLGLLPLLCALGTPLLGLLALGSLVVETQQAHRAPADAALPAQWSATPLTAEDIAREAAAEAGADAAAPEPAAQRAHPDDLTQIWGIGPKTAAALAAEGITTFAALAAADKAEVVRILRAAGIRSGDVDAWRAEAVRRQAF